MFSRKSSSAPKADNKSNIQSSARVVNLTVAEFVSLYEGLRGYQRASQKALKAQDLFSEDKLEQALTLILEIETEYMPRHSKIILGPDDKNDNREQKNHRKVTSAINACKEGLTVRIASKNKAEKKTTLPDKVNGNSDVLADSSIDIKTIFEDSRVNAQLISSLNATISDMAAQQEEVKKHFKFKLISNSQDIKEGELYFYRQQGKPHFIKVLQIDNVSGIVSAILLANSSKIEGLTLSSILEMAEKNKIVSLEPRESVSAIGKSNIHYVEGMEKPAAASSEQETNKQADLLPPSGFDPYLHLNPGAFQHLTAAIRALPMGIDAGAIERLHSEEFKKMKYDKVLDRLGSIEVAYISADSMRRNANKQYYTAVDSGKVNVSANDLRLRKAKDIDEDQKADRTKAKFRDIKRGIDAIKIAYEKALVTLPPI